MLVDHIPLKSNKTALISQSVKSSHKICNFHFCRVLELTLYSAYGSIIDKK